MAHRAAPHKITGLSPNKLMFGREVAISVDEMLEMPSAEQREERSKYVVNLPDVIEKVYANLWENLKRTAERQKRLLWTQVGRYMKSRNFVKVQQDLAEGSEPKATGALDRTMRRSGKKKFAK